MSFRLYGNTQSITAKPRLISTQNLLLIALVQLCGIALSGRMLLCELNLAAEERSAFLECGRPDAVLAAIRADAGFSAAKEDKVAAFGVASVDHGFTSLFY